MRLFVLGAPCAGKTTIAAELRRANVPVLDTDDEILRHNGGVWPDIETKNTRLLPLVLADAAARTEVVLFNSYMPIDRTQHLRDSGFDVALLEVSASELKQRDDRRLTEEGWTNREWFAWHQTVIREHLDAGLVDHVIDGERDPATIAADIIAMLRSARSDRWSVGPT